MTMLLMEQSIAQTPAFLLHIPSDVRFQPPYHVAALSCCSTSSSSKSFNSVSEWSNVRPFLPPDRCRSTSPAESLGRGEWFKLICGASFEDLPAVRNLALVYTLAGADCIDVAAEEAVIEAASRDGMQAAQKVADAIGAPVRAPWLMTSVNDDEEDPHFRKAFFDPSLCPTDCPRPCERICPTDAVVFPDSATPPAQRAATVEGFLGASPGGGVLGPRCYGCGRCIDVCPPGIIKAEKYKRSPQVIRRLLKTVEAVEIHTKGDVSCFRRLWEESIAEAASSSLKLVAVSFPDLGTDMGLTLASMNEIMGLEGTAAKYEAPIDERMAESHTESPNRADRTLNVWQTDGRPMSGDIGTGTTTACIRLAKEVLDSRVLPFGEGHHFVQLAGGTNARTVPKLREMGLLGVHSSNPFNQGEPPYQRDEDGGSFMNSRRRGGVAGVAYGGYARKAVGSVLDRLPAIGAVRVEDHPDVLVAAVEEASLLIGGLKRP